MVHLLGQFFFFFDAIQINILTYEYVTDQIQCDVLTTVTKDLRNHFTH